MRYAWIEQHKRAYAVRFLCRITKVSVAGYYRWRSRPVSTQQRRRRRMQSKVIDIYYDFGKCYGAPRIARELRAIGLPCSVNYVASILRDSGLRGRNGRGFKYRPAIEKRTNVAPNILQRNFTATRANQKWVADITYIPVQNRWVYLALDMAFKRRRVKPGLIVHSDRGVQYRSHAYKRMLLKMGCVVSMSRPENCWDNAAMESFFSRFKVELIHAERFDTIGQAQSAIFEYIEIFYDKKRRHSAIGYISSCEFEKLCA